MLSTEIGVQAPEVPLLAVFADVQATYGCGAGKKETASLCLKGLRMESQIASNEERSTSDVVAHLHGGILRHGAGITQVCSMCSL